MLEFCKQLIWPCPLDEPGLIRILFIFQGLLKNRKLSASEQSSSCLPRACRLLPLGKERCSSFHFFFFHKSSSACDLPYKWGGKDRERCSYTTWHGSISYIISPATAFPRNPDPSRSDPMYVATDWLLTARLL